MTYEREIMTSLTQPHIDREVRAVIDQVYQAWAENDADAFVVPYAQDATALLPGSYLPNREAIHASMKAAFSGPLLGSTPVHEVEAIRYPSPDTAIVIGKSATVLAGQSEPVSTSRGHDTWVLSRYDGMWQVHAFHTSPE
ncbi:SgcJ/EcaC family oxidoreductase [Nonomuraea dietziae]